MAKPKQAAKRKTGAARKKATAKKKKTPWEKPAPSKSKHTQLTAADKKKAKQRAHKAGRPYPNLVDNMTVAKRKRAAKKKKSA